MDKDERMSGLLGPLLNIVLLAPVIGLALVAFFAAQEIALTIGARLIAMSVEGSVRGGYALVTVRNLWLVGGGLLLVACLIYVLDSAFKHWRSWRLRRLLMRALAIEALIIALGTLAVILG